MKSSHIRFVSLVLLLFFGSAASAADTDGCLSTAWPHELSALEPDPSIHFGRLENGLRYVLLSNSEPRDRVAVYLNVEAGSLHEKQNERGLAHYLEHMLFNGTTHFPPGELIDYFRSIGMSFGADVNGYTTYTDTVYTLVVPEGTAQSLDQALLVMRDYADGALLLEEEIERERGVILAEKTARDSARYRSTVARNSFVLRNTAFPERQPIGVKEVLLQAGQEDLRGFYRRWYRPDNMILVLVGDFELDSTKELIAARFNSMQAAETVDCPEYGWTDHAGVEAFYHFEPDLGVTTVAIETVRNKSPENDSLRLQQDSLLRYMASLILNHRLEQLQEAADTPFISAGYSDTVMFDRFRITGIRATTKKESWKQSLGLIESELRKMLDYGISQDELERVRKDLRADLENQVLSAETRNSMRLISHIIASLDANRVLLSPAQELELFAPYVEAVTVEDIHRLFRDTWSSENRLIQLVGDAELSTPPGEGELLAFYESLKARKISEPAQRTVPAFPYLEVAGSEALPLHTTDYAKIGAQRVDFANGLILNLKVTDFKKNQVRAALHFGDGQRSLPKKGLGMLASSVVNGSGTARLTATQLEAALSGSSVRYSFGVGEESFELSGRAVSGEIELLLQVLHALLADPGFRGSAYERSMKRFEAMYRRLENSVEGGARLHLANFFNGNARTTGLPSWEQFSTLELSDVKEWLMPYFQGAPLELTVVGEFEPEQVIELAASYFDPPGQRAYTVQSHPQAQFPAGQQLETTVRSAVDKALVRYAWLTDDYHDIKRTRRLHLLAATLDERLRLKIREELGAAYSPSVYSVNSRIYEGFGAIYADVVVEETLVDTVVHALDQIESSIVSNRVDDEELHSAQSPILTSLKDGLRTNGYWLHSVLSLSSRNPDQLDWPSTLIDDFGSISSGEINELAKRYIRSDRRAVGIVRSEGTEEFSSVDQGTNRNGVLPDDNS